MQELRCVTETGDGPPLVFLHGWSANGRFFSPQLALAASGRRVIVPDLPGHGHDCRPAARIAIADMAQALDHFIARRDLKDIVLVGWSMGAMVAFDYIARHGTARLSGLVVVDMSARIVNDDRWRLGIASGIDGARADAEAEIMARDWPLYAERITHNLFAPGLGEGHPLRRFAAAQIAANDGETLAYLWRSLARADHRPTLQHVGVPALVIAGAESQIYRREATEWVAKALPNAEYELIEGAGHTPQLERPERFNAAVEQFMAAQHR